MPNKYSEINEISKRITSLSELYPSNKVFLDQCEIKNHSLITDLKKRRIKNPSAGILAKIVKYTGCSATWLLTGRGSMFDQEADYVEEGVSYVMIKKSINLIEEFDKRIDEANDDELTPDMEIKLTKCLLKILERRSSMLKMSKA